MTHKTTFLPLFYGLFDITILLQSMNEHCILLACATGHNPDEMTHQDQMLKAGFITYLAQKQAAGIANPSSTNPAQVNFSLNISACVARSICSIYPYHKAYIFAVAESNRARVSSLRIFQTSPDVTTDAQCGSYTTN